MVSEDVQGPVIVEEEGKPLNITEEEIACLSLGQKFCVMEESSLERFLTNMEMSFLSISGTK